MKSNPCHTKLLKLLFSQERYVNFFYTQLAKELSMDLKKYSSKSKFGPWVNNARFEKKIDKALISFNADILNHITEQQIISWGLADDCNDTLINSYTKGFEVPEDKTKQYLFRNQKALNAFIDRKDYGLKLSDRVWTNTLQTKNQLEVVLQSGILEGRSAKSMATDLKQFLNQPDRRYRRIRDKNGKLIYTNPATDYKPGRGVYKSSYKNALRLAKNEINISYKTSDHNRRQKLDFVVGVKVNLSSSHPRLDICDHLKGSYPKDFKFSGWHTGCICFQTTKLLPKKEFLEYLNTGKIHPLRYTQSIPKGAQNHINEISDRIKGWKNPPYFIRDNFKSTKKGFELIR